MAIKGGHRPPLQPPKFIQWSPRLRTMGAMTLLILFAALAGAATALTPCVLPVLPALLSASATGGRRRPLGVVLGLTASHTLVIVALGSLVNRIGLADASCAPSRSSCCSSSGSR